MSEVDVSAVLVLSDDGPDLEEILRQYGTEFSDRKLVHEFVLVLDGIGAERTASIRARIPEQVPVRLVQFNQSFGEERALASGFAESKGCILLSLPSYMQLDPGDVHLVLDALSSNYDLVVGWRVPRVDPWINQLQSWVFNRVMSTLTGVRLHDMNSGLLGLRRDIANDVLVEGNAGRFLPVMAHRKGHRVGEVRVRHLHERGRTGFFGIGVYMRRVLDVVGLLFITRFTRKPLRFFGMAGGLCALLGLGILGYLGLDFWFKWSGTETDLASRASLLLGAMLFMLGVMIFSMGLVAEILIFLNARNLQEYNIELESGPGRAAADDGARPEVEDVGAISTAVPIAPEPVGQRPESA